MPRHHARSAAATSTDSGQSSVMGVVLIVAVTVLGVTGIMLFGATALQDSQTRSEVDSAEHAMTQLDSRFSLVALGSAERQGASIALRSGASMSVDGDRGWMNVSVVDRDEGDFEILNTTLGAITYENGGSTVAYQGGGVWRKSTGGGSVMVSPPEFHYRTQGGDDPTLTLPLVVVRGSGSLGEEAIATKEETIPGFPNGSKPDHANPLRGGEINITVRSEYYEAWGAFFEDRTGGSVTYDHDGERVMITLEVEETSGPVRGGIVSGSGGTTLDFHNHAETDSYNSTDGSYDDSKGGNTAIIVAGDFELGNHGKVNGSLEVGGSVYLNNNAEITGDVDYGGSLDNDGVIGGETRSGADVASPRAVDWLIDERIGHLSVDANNDNDATADVNETTNRFDDCGSTCELDAGRYYLEEIDLDGTDLRLDTSDGDIEIAVDGDVTYGDTTVEVVGGNKTKFFVDGETSLGGSTNVTVPDERSPGTWLYMKPGSTISFGNGARFVGVVYGPGSGAQSGVEIGLSNDVEVYGGLVGDIDFVNNHMDIHFDEALVHENPLDGYEDDQPTVTYMHVTINRVNVSSR